MGKMRKLVKHPSSPRAALTRLAVVFFFIIFFGHALFAFTPRGQRKREAKVSLVSLDLFFCQLKVI